MHTIIYDAEKHQRQIDRFDQINQQYKGAYPKFEAHIMEIFRAYALAQGLCSDCLDKIIDPLSPEGNRLIADHVEGKVGTMSNDWRQTMAESYCQVENGYTYSCQGINPKVGDTVELPHPFVSGATFWADVIALGRGDYDGPCRSIIRKVDVSQVSPEEASNKRRWQ